MDYRMLNYIACVLLLQPAVVVAIEQTPSSPRHADVEVTSAGSVASSSWEQSQADSDRGLMRTVRQEEAKMRKNEEDVQGRSMFEEEEEERGVQEEDAEEDEEEEEEDDEEEEEEDE